MLPLCGEMEGRVLLHEFIYKSNLHYIVLQSLSGYFARMDLPIWDLLTVRGLGPILWREFDHLAR
jgi:hypothetical protein